METQVYGSMVCVCVYVCILGDHFLTVNSFLFLASCFACL